MENLNNLPPVSLDVQEVLKLFTAESLFHGTPILSQVLELRNTLSRETDGSLISYDDMFLRIQEEVDALPSLSLEIHIASGMEGAYQRQLLHALEKINDDCDAVLRKVIKLKSRMFNAKSLLNNKLSQFTAFYALSVPAAIYKSGLKLKLSADNISKLAESEFSCLVDGLDNLAPSLISELEILEIEVKQHKKTQTEKYQLGKDQVNAAWSSVQSVGNGVSLDEDAGKLLKPRVEVEEFDEIPSYVSRITKEVKVAANPSLEPRSKPDTAIKGGFFKQGTPQPVTVLGEHKVVGWDDLDDLVGKKAVKSKPLLAPYDDFCLLDTDCSKCGKRQFNCPSGATCPNGHGGADGVERGKPLVKETIIEDLDAFVKDYESQSIATKAPSTPRNKLTIMEEDESI